MGAGRRELAATRCPPAVGEESDCGGEEGEEDVDDGENHQDSSKRGHEAIVVAGSEVSKIRI